MKNERVSELTTYLNALTTAHAAGYKCHGEIGEALKELRTHTMLANTGDPYIRYKMALKSIIGDDNVYGRKEYQRMLFTNRTIYEAYANYDADLNMYFGRCSGTTTSIQALMTTFEDVAYIENERNLDTNVTGKVVFIERDLQLPRGVRPARTIRIRQIDDGRLY